MASPCSSPTQQTSMFLRIPLELRLQIYEYLLLLPRTPRHLGRRRRSPDDDDARVHAAILAVCAQTHDEASSVLYGSNVFLAHTSLLTTMARLRPWHRPISETTLSSSTTTTTTLGIRRWWVRVRLDVAPAWTAAAVEAAFSGADEVVLEAWQAMYLGAGGVDALRRFEGVRGVRVVKIFGGLAGLEGYARWLKRAMMAPVGAQVPGYVAADEAEQKRLTGWSGDVIAFTGSQHQELPKRETSVMKPSAPVESQSRERTFADMDLKPENEMDREIEAKTIRTSHQGSHDFAAAFSEIATVLMG